MYVVRVLYTFYHIIYIVHLQILFYLPRLLYCDNFILILITFLCFNYIFIFFFFLLIITEVQ